MGKGQGLHASSLAMALCKGEKQIFILYTRVKPPKHIVSGRLNSSLSNESNLENLVELQYWTVWVGPGNLMNRIVPALF
jgi:hypothetical protein